MDDNSVRGMAFPFRITAEGGVAMQSGPAKIRQNVRMILGTRVGERPMRRDFGARVASLAQEANNAALLTVLKNQAMEALLTWEPRILVTDTRLERLEETGEVVLHITYRHTNEPIEGEATIAVDGRAAGS